MPWSTFSKPRRPLKPFSDRRERELVDYETCCAIGPAVGPEGSGVTIHSCPDCSDGPIDPKIAAQVDFAEAAGLALVSGKPDERSDLAAGVAEELNGSIEFLAELAEGSDDVEFLGKLLASVRELRRVLANCHDSIEDAMTAWMEARGLWQVELPKVGVLVRHSGKKRTKWAHDAILDSLYHEVLCGPEHNPETGERVPAEERVLQAIRGAAGIGYWRTSALKKWGLVADHYCETSEGRQSVEIK